VRFSYELPPKGILQSLRDIVGLPNVMFDALCAVSLGAVTARSLFLANPCGYPRAFTPNSGLDLTAGSSSTRQ